MNNMESKTVFFSNSIRKFIDHSTLAMNHYKKRLIGCKLLITECILAAFIVKNLFP